MVSRVTMSRVTGSAGQWSRVTGALIAHLVTRSGVSQPAAAGSGVPPDASRLRNTVFPVLGKCVPDNRVLLSL